jgi:FixJ family two-component response regulator
VARKLVVFVVDDDELLRNAVARLLQLVGLQASQNVLLIADKAAFNEIVYRRDYRDDRKPLRLP